jgi:hypothetical protein
MLEICGYFVVYFDFCGICKKSFARVCQIHADFGLFGSRKPLINVLIVNVLMVNVLITP